MRLTSRLRSASLRAWCTRALLCAALLAVQAGALLHHLDLTQHLAPEQCELCLALANTAGGVLPTAGPAFAPSAVPAAVMPLPCPAPHLRVISSFAIRAPPIRLA